jgi:hypothetical protein
MNLVQIKHPTHGRRVAIVEEPSLVVLESPRSAYELALNAAHSGGTVAALAEEAPRENELDYEAIYLGHSDWKLLPAFDHPQDPMHCLVSGTGLTHNASAQNRQRMHEAQAAGHVTDSMRMYQWGVEGGRPAANTIGVQPEWFFKGTGHVLRAHGQAIEQPAYADDGGEEPEVAAAYVIDKNGTPWRVGFAPGNEFSDHVMEKKNYLYLAHSKLRQCAIGPELVLDETFEALAGHVTILREGDVLWTSPIQSGEANMAHSLANLEYHQFKYAENRVPGLAHVHFLGAAAFSFGAQVMLQNGDIMEIAWHGLGRPLRNPLSAEHTHEEYVAVSHFR